MEGAREVVYKTVGTSTLKLWVYSQGAEVNRPAIIFFFGGGWNNGSPQQFSEQCQKFASRGMVAMAADYRVLSRHGVKPIECIADARSAVRFIRAQAQTYGIDPQRIAAAGGSAGGHLAAATAFINQFDDASEDQAISAVPNALVLFNPALVMAPLVGVDLQGFGKDFNPERFGALPEQISPAHHVTAGGPPTIIFHGRADATVPLTTAAGFMRAMQAVGNRCELVGYDDQPHGFFNKEPFKAQTLAAADAFLVSLGWLKAQP
jgi:acetyl esterase/lipase